MFELRPETAQDHDEVEWLYDLCFAPGRTALSSYRLRDDVAPLRSLGRIARDGDGILAGAIRLWPVMAAGKPTLLLGPIAVHPTRQGEGLGGLLMHASLEAARAANWQRVMLVGDYPYYRRFGFSKLDDIVMPPPTNPDRVLGLELVPGAWKGLRGPVTKIV